MLGERFGNVDLRELRKMICWVSSSLQEKLYVRDLTQNVVINGNLLSLVYMIRFWMRQALMELASQPNAPMMLCMTHYIEETRPVFSHTLFTREGKS